MNSYIFGDFFEMAAREFALYVEALQENWRSMVAPGAVGGTGSMAKPTADELARSMDIAIGAV